MPDLFVLAKAPPVNAWQAVAGPVDAAGAGAAVTRALEQLPAGRVVVVRVIRSFRASVTTTEDQTATADP